MSSPSQDTVSSFASRVSSRECEQVAEKGSECFDRLSTNGKCSIISSSARFALRLSKGGRCFFSALAGLQPKQARGVGAENFFLIIAT